MSNCLSISFMAVLKSVYDRRPYNHKLYGSEHIVWSRYSPTTTAAFYSRPAHSHQTAIKCVYGVKTIKQLLCDQNEAGQLIP